ncbi:hypothetical protein BO94DRAFT_44039 [Aspergillus sclerotioniger CBS 115572]|uniref:Uncharacterized protein n=1 Tax=Aspergillus sclerotioniger CBS 115572 TaxID=1450535 RepID=A0A317WWY8_9EURO|nr:hypothetical protein BO94DRAFT_44039 [Aspergillus sclerotioniger CBS 115572]PWY89707.1 hypothetical protein BO94DRAFT_44039 [Aspergillus sclerotioniger CBS 115572]
MIRWPSRFLQHPQPPRHRHLQPQMRLRVGQHRGLKSNFNTRHWSTLTTGTPPWEPPFGPHGPFPPAIKGHQDRQIHQDHHCRHYHRDHFHQE